MPTSSNRIQKLLTFSPQLYANAQSRAGELGVPFAEYLRHLIMKDVENEAPVEMVDGETEKRIGESLAAYDRGEYFTLTTETDIENFVNGKLSQLVRGKSRQT